MFSETPDTPLKISRSGFGWPPSPLGSPSLKRVSIPQPRGVLSAYGVMSRQSTPVPVVTGIAFPFVSKALAAPPLTLMRETPKNQIAGLSPPDGGVPTLPVVGF